MTAELETKNGGSKPQFWNRRLSFWQSIILVVVLGIVAGSFLLFVYVPLISEYQNAHGSSLGELNYTVPEHSYNTTVSETGDMKVFEGKVVDVRFSLADPDVIIFEDGTIVKAEFADYQPWKLDGVQKVTVDYGRTVPKVEKVDII